MSRVSRPRALWTKRGNINQPASSTRLWYPTIDQIQFIRNNHTKDIFKYSGPGANATGSYQGANWQNPRCDHTCACFYYVILHAPPKVDTVNSVRQLGGIIVPWAYEGDNGPSENDNPASVHWHAPADLQTFTQWNTDEDLGISDGRIWSSGANYPSYVDPGNDLPLSSTYETYASMGRNIELFDHRDPGMQTDKYKTFRWTPESDGGFTYGILETRQIQVAALTIFECPDQPIAATPDQDIVQRKGMSPTSFVQGWESGVDSGYGDLVHNIGNADTYGAGVQDSAINGALHCLYQSGGPMAWYTNSGTYVNLRGDEASYIRVSAPNFTNGDTSIEIYPSAILSGTGLSDVDKGYLKLTAKSTGDTWTLEITTNGVKLYHTDDGDQASLTIKLDSTPADNYEDIKVELKVADGGGSDKIFLNSLALWCADPFTYTA